MSEQECALNFRGALERFSFSFLISICYFCVSLYCIILVVFLSSSDKRQRACEENCNLQKQISHPDARENPDLRVVLG